MSESKAGVSEVVDALQGRGFDYLGVNDDGWLKFKGGLSAGGEVHACHVLIDPAFHALPDITLTTIPATLKPVAPHIAADGGICYLAKNSVVVDIFDPVGQTLAFVKRAELVLEKLLKHEMVEDMEEEFFAFWHGKVCLTDFAKSELGEQHAIWVGAGELKFLVASDNPELTKAKLTVVGWKFSDASVPVYRVKTQAKPRPSQTEWPPTTVSQLLHWQGSLDMACRKKLSERIDQAKSKKASEALLLIESPLLTYGVVVRFNEGQNGGDTSKASSAVQGTYAAQVVPCAVTRIDDRYLAGRNMPGKKTLAGKQITLVGCGTIGGYLAEMLVKAGAGTGGGQLTLIDNDNLMPNNLGRHRLGFPALFRNKAFTMSFELQFGWPSAKIRALQVDVRTANLAGQDLIIDATGEEALGHWLASKVKTLSPMLSVWIEGPGTAVRGLFWDRGETACYRCLYHHAQDGRYQAVSGGVPSVMAGQGCEGIYVPFPASVSVQAASLGAEMALGWVSEELDDKLQTRLLDKSLMLETPDCNPELHAKCPVCGS